MKLRYLGVIPLSLLSSCSNKEQVYYNVTTSFDRDNFVYNVYVDDFFYPNLKKRDYKVSIDNVYYVEVNQYYCTETCSTLALNEFHIKNSSYKLVFYTHKWFVGTW